MAKRTTLTVMVVGLAAIGAFVAASPEPPASTVVARNASVSGLHAAGAQGGTGVARSEAAHRRRSRAAATERSRAAASKRAKSNLDGPATGTPTRTVQKVIVHTVRTSVRAIPPARAAGAGTVGGAASGTASAPPAPAPHVPACSDYRWQQDAQAAYVANLDDPYGLDGAPGPNDDDGIACSLLPVDPARPPSTPAGAKPLSQPEPRPEPPPTTPTRDELIHPALDYYGVSTPQAPFDWKDFELFVSAAQKRPNLLMFFSGWDRDYPADKVVETWRRDMLPVITWEPRATVQSTGPSDGTVQPDDITLASIIDGSHDAYIEQYAKAVAASGLPIGLRFAHEMNGPWYPWSEQSNGNHPGEFVQAWRHVHDIFTVMGATNVIWIWSPSRVNPYPDVPLGPLYPGDDYVDWLGMSGYFRITDQTPSFDRTFGQTLDALAAISDKPILLSEVGATESDGVQAKKVAWIDDLFAGMKDHPEIVGFSWFDQSVDGNDWRIESSAAATGAFAAGVADARYGTGVWAPR